MKIKVWVDRVKCATFASCTIAADPVFVLDDEGKAVMEVEKIKENPLVKSIIQEKGEQDYPHWILELDHEKKNEKGESLAHLWVEENITAGAMRCPVFAIVVTDMETGKVIFPN
jgi:ferredoxin